MVGVVLQLMYNGILHLLVMSRQLLAKSGCSRATYGIAYSGSFIPTIMHNHHIYISAGQIVGHIVGISDVLRRVL